MFKFLIKYYILSYDVVTSDENRKASCAKGWPSTGDRLGSILHRCKI